MTKLKKKTILITLLILLAIWLVVPYIIRATINKKLDEMPGLKGQIQTVSISVFKGSVSFEQIQIEKVNAKEIKPAFSATDIIFSIAWADLFKGHFNTHLSLDNPKLYFVQKPKAKPSAKEEVAPSTLWQQTQRQLLPLKIDEITVQNGEMHYINRTEKPAFDMQINNINVVLTGLQAEPSQDNPLPAHLTVSAQILGQAQTDVQIAFNPKAKTPSFKIIGKIDQLQLNKANDFLHHYTKLTADQGVFSLYLEAAANNGKIQGYVKPFIEGLEVSLPQKDKNNPIKVIYRGAVQVVNNILENNQTNKAATQIDIGGPIDDPNASLWSTIGNLLQNAFLKALLPGIDHSVKLPS